MRNVLSKEHDVQSFKKMTCDDRQNERARDVDRHNKEKEKKNGEIWRNMIDENSSGAHN